MTCGNHNVTPHHANVKCTGIEALPVRFNLVARINLVLCIDAIVQMHLEAERKRAIALLFAEKNVLTRDFYKGGLSYLTLI